MDELTSDLATVTRDIRLHVCFQILAISCLYYDHLITFGLEFEHLWSRPTGHSSYWFFLNRYFAFFANLVVLTMGFTNFSPDCLKYTLFRQILLIFNQVLVCVMLTLRIYALYNRSKPILTIMLTSGAVLAAVACFVMFGQKTATAPQQSPSIHKGCYTGLAKGTAIRLAGAWEALFAYDSIIFTLTVWKTMKERKERRITGVNIALVDLLLRDGAMYYMIMALCNLANIMTFYFGGPFFRGSLSTFSSCISNTMLSRLMLNLHQTADKGIYTTQVTNTQFDYGEKYLSTQNPVELDTIWSSPGPTEPTVTFQDTTQLDQSIVEVDAEVVGSSHRHIRFQPP